MAKKKFNVKGVEAGGDFVEAPIGLYVGKIVEPKLEKPDDKDERVHVQIELQGKGRGNEPLEPPKGSRYGRLHDYVNLESEAAAFKVMQYLIAIGKVDPDDEKSKTGSVDWEKELDGQLILVRVKHEPYDGETRAKPGNVMPYDEDEAGDPDDDDDDDDSSTDDSDDDDDETDEDDESGDDDSDDESDDDEDESSDDDELWTEEELKELDTAALKEEAFNATDDEDNPGFGLDKKKFLKKKGDKKVLDKAKVIKAILEAQEAKQADGDDEDDEDDKAEAEDYSSWTDKKLKAELKERELKVKGAYSKAKAVKALKADDEEDPF